MKSLSNCLFRISGWAILTALLATTARSETLGGTVIYGTSAVPSALVSLYETTSHRKVVTRTNSGGAFLFKELPAGSYVVLVEKDAKRIYQGKVDVRQDVTTFDIRL